MSPSDSRSKNFTEKQHRVSRSPGPRAWAILPAAGRSRRMGQAKLLLPWGEGVLVDGIVSAWQTAEVNAIIAVVHPLDQKLAEHLRGRGVQVVAAESPPPQMKDSVQIALAYVRNNLQPTDADCWLLAPADMPGLSPDVIRRVIEQGRQQTDRIVIPTHMGRNGHPALFPWRLAEAVSHLRDDEGVNAILASDQPLFVECGPAALASDVDTPEDYRQIRGD